MSGRLRFPYSTTDAIYPNGNLPPLSQPIVNKGCASLLRFSFLSPASALLDSIVRYDVASASRKRITPTFIVPPSLCSGLCHFAGNFWSDCRGSNMDFIKKHLQCFPRPPVRVVVCHSCLITTLTLRLVFETFYFLRN